MESCQSSNVKTMPTPNRASFDGVTIALHWTTVVLVLALLTTALLHAQSHAWHRRGAMRLGPSHETPLG